MCGWAPNTAASPQAAFYLLGAGTALDVCMSQGCITQRLAHSSTAHTAHCEHAPQRLGRAANKCRKLVGQRRLRPHDVRRARMGGEKGLGKEDRPHHHSSSHKSHNHSDSNKRKRDESGDAGLHRPGKKRPASEIISLASQNASLRDTWKGQIKAVYSNYSSLLRSTASGGDGPDLQAFQALLDAGEGMVLCFVNGCKLGLASPGPRRCLHLSSQSPFRCSGRVLS